MSLIGRQPISTTSYQVVAYDILFRDEEVQLDDCCNDSISASVLERILDDFGIENVLGGYEGYLKVDLAFLSSSIVNMIPKSFFRLMILDSSLYDPLLVSIVEKLSSEGFRFGINDTALNLDQLEKIQELLTWVDVIKIDTLRMSDESAAKIIASLRAMGKQVVATKIESDEVFESFKRMGVDRFQGYFIKRPYLLHSDSLSASYEDIMDVWDLLQNDTDDSVIVKAFEENHLLAIQLIRFVHSSQVSFDTANTSLKELLALMGREKLRDWFLLMLKSYKCKQASTHPLLLMAINRTEIMRGLVKLCRTSPDEKELNTAYFVGLLSLIHLLLNVEHREILRKLNVSPDIEEAMFEAQGGWGELVTVTRYIENVDSPAIETFVKRYNIDTKEMDALIREAMEKVNRFDEMLQAQFI